MEIKDGIHTFYADSPQSWRAWLEQNHEKEKSVWLIIYKKDSNIPSLTYNEAVDEALCFGWIDSKPNKRDENSFYQFFAKRNPKSNWSKVNKEKVAHLIEGNKMIKAGFDSIALAQKTGTWDALNAVEALEIPTDLSEAFERNSLAREYFDKFPKSVKKGILEWIQNAKQQETRAKRIAQTVEMAAQNLRANYPNQIKK